MAKYKLTTGKGNDRLVECVVLDHNPDTRQYLVEFSNGVRKYVSKARVSDLDIIDEAILDRIKDAAKKAGSAVVSTARKLWNVIAEKGSYVMFMFKGKPARAASPLSIQFAAANNDAVGFYPSEQLMDVADEIGVDAFQVDYDLDSAADKELEDNERIWQNLIDYLVSKGEYVVEGDNDNDIRYVKALNEDAGSSSYTYSTAEIERYLKGEPEEHGPNMSIGQIKDAIAVSYSSLLSVSQYQHESDGEFDFSASGLGDVDDYGVPKDPEKLKLLPILIWGAPGIGKTECVNQLISEVKNALNSSDESPFKGDMNMIAMDLSQLAPDDLTLPAITSDEYGQKFADDILKRNIMPMYEVPDKKDPDYAKKLRDLDIIANGGNPATGTTGLGGILFLDELSRTNRALMTMLMTMVQKRTISGGRYALGSKWLIVAAANRAKDGMSDFIWDQAWSGRFKMVNYVPKIGDWIKYERRRGMMDKIVNFIEANPQYWIAAVAGGRAKRNQVVKLTNPRGWESLANEIAAAMSRQSDIAYRLIRKNSDDEEKNWHFKKTKYGWEVDPEDVKRNAESYIDPQAAGALYDYLKLGEFYNDKDIEDILTMGAEAPIRFSTNTPIWKDFVPKQTISSLAARFQIQQKNIRQQNKDMPQSQVDREATLTPDEFRNLLMWFVKLCAQKDNSGNDMVVKGYKLPSGKITDLVLINNATWQNIYSELSSGFKQMGLSPALTRQPEYVAVETDIEQLINRTTQKRAAEIWKEQHAGK